MQPEANCRSLSRGPSGLARRYAEVVEERRAARTAVVVAVGVLVGAIAIVLVVRGGSSGDGEASLPGPSSSSVPSGPTTTAASAGGAGCDGVHAGHQMKMWNPTMADEMVDAGCGWPYPPFQLEEAAGADSPDLDAPFEPTHYAELWQRISGSGFGTCAVATDLEGGEPGALFEFTYRIGPPGCPGAAPTGELIVAEYGTEAQRDAAAVVAGDGSSFVLGRWNLRLSGDADQLEPALVAMGAQRAG